MWFLGQWSGTWDGNSSVLFVQTLGNFGGGLYLGRRLGRRDTGHTPRQEASRQEASRQEVHRALHRTELVNNHTLAPNNSV